MRVQESPSLRFYTDGILKKDTEKRKNKNRNTKKKEKKKARGRRRNIISLKEKN